MKKHILFIFLLFVFGLQAQIQVERFNLNVGDVIYLANDSTGNFNLQAAGSNLQWDMSQLQSIFTDSISPIAPSTTLQAEHFEEANLSFGTTQLCSYSSLTDDAFVHLGFGGLIDSLDISSFIKLSIPDTQIVFPIQYGDSRNSFSWGESEPISVNVPVLGEQTLKLSHSTQRTCYCDAWGTMQTPVSSYEVLRVQEKVITIDSVFLMSPLPFIPPVFLGDYSNFDTTDVYRFYTNDVSIKLPLAEVTYDPNTNQSLYAKWVTFPGLNIKEVPVSTQIQVFPNPATDYVTVTSEVDVEQYEILNSLGQWVEKGLVKPHNMITVGHLPEGVYFLKLFGKDKFIQSSKIIKK